MDPLCYNPPNICIVGAGFSGLCAAIQLRKQLNIETVTIFDENEDIGGTWLTSVYPGCACDVPSHLYSFSFEPNPNWSRYYPGQQEIWNYLRNVAEKYNLYPMIKFRHQVVAINWDEKVKKYHVKIFNREGGTENDQVFDIIISSIGALRVPNYPPQFERFCKQKFHSARWNSSIDLQNKEVAIIGCGASAIQIIPEIVKEVKKLTVYQRKPVWMLPKTDFAFPNWAKWTFANIPGVQWLLRNWIFWTNELYHSAYSADSVLNTLSTKYSRWHLGRQIANPELRERVRPDYEFGCKRVGISSDYYPALAQPNVNVITSKIVDVTEDVIINEDGTVTKPEVLILATGYSVQDFFTPMQIIGKRDENICEKWKNDRASVYLGISCSSLPNFFFLHGPNTVLRHNSILFSIECQVNFMIQVIREMSKQNSRTVVVKKSAEDDYMNTIMSEMKPAAWNTNGCRSVYGDNRGVLAVLYPKSSISYYDRTKAVNFSHFEFC